MSTLTRANGSQLARLMTRTPALLTRYVWIWPLVGAVMVVAIGLWVRSRVEQAMKDELASQMQTMLNANVAALQTWFAEQEADAKSFAADSRVRELVAQLNAQSDSPGFASEGLADAPAVESLDRLLMPLLTAQHYVDFVVVGTNGQVLASPRRRLVGRPAPRAYEQFLSRSFDGRCVVSRPFAREVPAGQRAGGPTMFVAAPVYATNGTLLAALGLRMKPEDEFTRILSVARMGETGEAYAFDRSGLMLTASRFDPDLKLLGLITNSPDATSILNLRLLDPGVDLWTGKAPHKPAANPRLTRMAADAVHGRSGVDVVGYRNYAGMTVVGAWTWLPEYGMGAATEVAASEAFRPLHILRQTFLVLFSLLVLSGLVVFLFTLVIKRLETAARNSALAARRLGQYVLVQEIGRGASGIVYRARHSLLRRPVAIKLLSPELTNAATAADFEHEVQITSQLTHPNTVAVYDYGRTPEGIFYYAMEFLDGIDLDRLVRTFGPQPEGRVIHILRQVCGSLAEAHAAGLIHRDIKPANIVLTRRGGAGDVVKVLDFGLVRPIRRSPAELDGNALAGTPRYMSPETITSPEHVDARSDLYSLGAVGYWLLTGRPVFEGDDMEILLQHHVHTPPTAPSSNRSEPMSPELDEIIRRCLAKQPGQRPQTAEELRDALARCPSQGSWTALDAEKWWKANLGMAAMPAATTMAEKTVVIAPRA